MVPLRAQQGPHLYKAGIIQGVFAWPLCLLPLFLRNEAWILPDSIKVPDGTGLTWQDRGRVKPVIGNSFLDKRFQLKCPVNEGIPSSSPGLRNPPANPANLQWCQLEVNVRSACCHFELKGTVHLSKVQSENESSGAVSCSKVGSGLLSMSLKPMDSINRTPSKVIHDGTEVYHLTVTKVGSFIGHGNDPKLFKKSLVSSLVGFGPYDNWRVTSELLCSPIYSEEPNVVQQLKVLYLFIGFFLRPHRHRCRPFRLKLQILEQQITFVGCRSTVRLESSRGQPFCHSIKGSENVRTRCRIASTTVRSA